MPPPEEDSGIALIKRMLDMAAEDEDIKVAVIFSEPKYRRMSMALMNCDMDEAMAMAGIVATTDTDDAQPVN
jgi:hypothetical protein